MVESKPFNDQARLHTSSTTRTHQTHVNLTLHILYGKNNLRTKCLLTYLIHKNLIHKNFNTISQN